MDDAPFARWHWVECAGFTAACDASCGSACKATEHVRPALSIVLYVNDYERLATKLTADDHADEELERL